MWAEYVSEEFHLALEQVPIFCGIKPFQVKLPTIILSLLHNINSCMKEMHKPLNLVATILQYILRFSQLDSSSGEKYEIPCCCKTSYRESSSPRHFIEEQLYSKFPIHQATFHPDWWQSLIEFKITLPTMTKTHGLVFPGVSISTLN
jgi:hypothetical protein